MSAYDNPKIVNDQSAMAWAQAFNVSGVMAQAAKDWRAERLYQKKIGEEKANKKALAWNKAALSNEKLLTEKVDDLRDKGINDDLIKQFQDEQRLLMNGDATVDPPIMGSIEAETLLMTDPNLDNKTRQEYSKIVADANTQLDNLVQWGGRIMMDVEEINTYKDTIDGPGKDVFWEGNNDTERLASQYGGMGLSNISMDGVDIKKSYKKDGGRNMLVVESTFKQNNKLFKGLDIEKMKKEGLIVDDVNKTYTLKLERDLDKWDGNLINKTEAITDYDNYAKSGNLIQENGDLAEGLKTTLDEETIINANDNTRRNVATKIFVDVKAMDRVFEEKLKGRVSGLLKTLSPQELVAYMEQRLNVGDVDMNKFINASPQAKEEVLLQLEMSMMREKYGLVDKDTSIPGFELQRRELSQADVNELTSNGISGYSVGDHGYYEINTKGMANPSSGDGGSSTGNQYDYYYNILESGTADELANMKKDLGATTISLTNRNAKIGWSDAANEGKGGWIIYKGTSSNPFDISDKELKNLLKSSASAARKN
tara:strand:- start:270 stop:1889 length:1620 start_codon:yes stop_codon:yes gene_type:complete